MRPLTARRLAPVIALLLVLLLVPALVAAQGGPPPIPHPLEGRDACLGCHEAGLAGAPKVPADHAGRTNDMCRLCHQPASAAPTSPTVSASPTSAASPTTAATSTVEATSTRLHLQPRKQRRQPPWFLLRRVRLQPVQLQPLRPCRQLPQLQLLAPSPTATRPAATATPAGPAPVPHTLEGRQDCLKCHIAPATKATAVGGPPTIPHTLVGRQTCLACHQEGIGGAPRVPQNHAGRTNDTCQGCHKPKEAAATPAPAAPSLQVPTPISHPKSAGANSCFDCHSKLGGKNADMAAQWQQSVHAERGVTCADCHGGNPAATTKEEAMSAEAGYVGVPTKAAIPALCASCHADVAQMRQYNLPTDQYAQYQESVHGTLLAKGDTNVATCYDCHGGHQVLKANDPASSVYPANVPKTCAGCHADKPLMAPYKIPTDQYDQYVQSVHGHAVLDEQNFKAPTCATCHGTHGAAPPGVGEVANVCGSCHGATQTYFSKSPHAQGGEGAPKCVTCHGDHDVSQPSEALYSGSTSQHCGACHTPDSAPGKAAQSINDNITSAANAYAEAEDGLKIARQLGMLVTPQENQLREANTSLITARAAQHTLDLDTVLKNTDNARKIADQAKAAAEAAVAESVFRRRAMVIAVVAIALTIAAALLAQARA